MTDFVERDRTAAIVERGLVRHGISPELRSLVLTAATGPAPIVPSALPRLGRAGAAGEVSFYRDHGKRVVDVLLVLITLPVSLTLIGICAIALWIEGGRPFYVQDRLGRNGRRFVILKLRTMVRNADECLENLIATDPHARREWEQTQKLKDDPRITPVGRFLRASSLDELPQLLNVLKGEMSLVGPRPMMPDQLPIYGDPRHYFDMRPGLTGIWQVSARNESRFSYRCEMDTLYYKSMSLARDLWLMLRTVGVVLRRTGY